MQAVPGISVRGVDLSTYAIENAKPEVKSYLQVANAKALPFEDNSFDVVISITTLHNLEGDDLDAAFKEVERVSKKGAFVTVDAYRTDEEKSRLEDWVLTAKTMMHVEQWKSYFQRVGYSGDFYWFTP
jgi:ubiquinone/menaquinone biosynthesis C-methylase UbiE